MTLITLGLLLLGLYLLGVVILVQIKGDTSIANFTWGAGVMLVALYTFFSMSHFLPRQILLTSMIVLWALRLIIYVYIRYTGKDPRFASWKWQGFKALIINLCWVGGQSIMIAIMGYPVALVNTGQFPGLTWLDVVGAIIWVFGFLFEAISDWQLFTFMRDPANKGHVMSYGLWHYSRHPNYFGEVVMWWGVYLVALSVARGWTAIIAPLTITVLIVWVTGIPLIEKALATNPEYEDYKKRTSAFIPWLAKE